MSILLTSITSAPTVTSDAYVDIPGLGLSLSDAGVRSGKVLVTLNVPTPYATGNDFPGIQFAISTDYGVVAEGGFTYSQKNPESSGRMPFTLVAAITVDGHCTFVKGQWKSIRGSTLHIDSYACLSVVSA
ncbi:hypothetical protein [Burkholderia ubonensis]|uniref:hypothetical protein n=1 Tax=Burkholderia ubonensis TaxID=101571 RepID=UPI000A9EC9B4|nr:hypothetical protein [Burkholderia ubonensis]